jgi:two-component system cell cycle response regulator
MGDFVMRYIATLLVVSDSPSNSLEPVLTAAGYHSVRLTFLQMFEQEFGDQSFDLIIFDGENNPANVDVKELAHLAAERNFPLLLVGPADIRCRIQTISPGFCDLELLTRVGALVRLGNMEQELARRIHTTESYGVDLSEIHAPEPDIGDAHILIVGNKTVVLGNVLLRLDTRTNIHICKNADLALDELRRGSFDAVILSGVGHGDSHLRLLSNIRADSRLYNLPLVMVLETTENRHGAYLHGVSDIILHDSEMDALANRVGLHIRQHRYRFAIQKLFRIAKPYPVIDGPTDLYSSGFMRAHLPLLFRDHAAQKKALSIASLKIANLDDITAEFGYPSGDQLLRQVGSALGALVRGEDFCCHYARGHFLVALPGTRLKEAHIALKRLGGVLRNTEFALPNVPAPLRIEIITGLAEVAAEESIDALVERGLTFGMDKEQAA